MDFFVMNIDIHSSAKDPNQQAPWNSPIQSSLSIINKTIYVVNNKSITIITMSVMDPK